MTLKDILQQLEERERERRQDQSTAPVVSSQEDKGQEVNEAGARTGASEVREVRYGGDRGYLPALIPLERIEVDADQPRGYLPAALRAGLVKGELDPPGVLAALVQAAEGGDVGAQGYVRSIADLAESLAVDGQIEPVGVVEVSEGRYRLIWGERRYWAAWWLKARGEGMGELACRVRIGEVDDEGLRRVQWVENLQREDVPAVRMAEVVGWIYRRALEEAAGGAGKSAVALARERAAEVLGRRISERMVYLCARVDGRLEREARELAAAWRFSFSDLNRLAARKGDEQVALARELAERRAGDERARELAEQREKRKAARMAGGKVRKWVDWSKRVKQECDRDDAMSLARMSEDDLRQIERAVLEAQQAVSRRLDAVRRAMWERAR